MRRLAPSILAGVALTLAFTTTAAADPPGNDNLGSATTLGATGTETGETTAESTLETDESSFFTDWGTDGDVWYSWTAPASGPIAFRTTNIGTTDTILAAHTGTDITNLTVVASNDDYPGCCASRILFNAVSGETYKIGVGPFSGSADNEGGFDLEWGSSTYYDALQPTLSVSPVGGKRSLTLNFSSSDETADVVGSSWVTYECSIDGGTFSSCTSPFTQTSAPGKHTWSVRATDGASNFSTQSGIVHVKGGPKV